MVKWSERYSPAKPFASAIATQRFQSGHVNPVWPSTEIDTSIITDPSRSASLGAWVNDSKRKGRGIGAPAWMQYSQNRPGGRLPCALTARGPLEEVDIVVYGVRWGISWRKVPVWTFSATPLPNA